jgi:anaerobic selenocysteine-containing dehydrogenase
MAHDGYDPLPTYHPPRWQELAELNDAGESTNALTSLQPSLQSLTQPLICISPPAHSFLNSTFANVERFRQREDQPLLHLHPQDARQRSISDGDSVVVENEHGCVQLRAHVSEGIIAGTVLAPGVWWAKFSPDGRNINQVTSQDEADMGAGALFYDVLVQVRALHSDCAATLFGTATTIG